MTVEKNRVVTLEYLLTNEAGEELDSSVQNGELSYIQGTDMMLEGVEKALEGKSKGERVVVSLSAADAYGEKEEDLVVSLPKSEFGQDEAIEPGMAFEIQMDDGSSQVFTVISLEGDVVNLDGNHPLAGMNLKFDLKISDVREASAEELDHGHPHCGGDGCGSCHSH